VRLAVMSDEEGAIWPLVMNYNRCFVQPVRPRQTMLVPIPIYHALLAVARAVDLAHLARMDSPKSECSTCQTLRALDQVYPKWRSECAKLKVQPPASPAPAPRPEPDSLN
jgi:hypothetical protein